MNTMHLNASAIVTAAVLVAGGCTTPQTSPQRSSVDARTMSESAKVAAANRSFMERSSRASLIYKRANLVLLTEDWRNIAILRSNLSSFDTNAFPIHEIQNRLGKKRLRNCDLAVVMVPQAKVLVPGQKYIDPSINIEKKLRQAGARRIVFLTMAYGVFPVEFPSQS